MSAQVRDTSREAEEVRLQLWRDMTPGQRMRAFLAINRMSRRALWDGLHERHPRADDAEIRGRYAALILGAELSHTVYAHQGGPDVDADIRAAIEGVTATMDALGIRYAIGGSIASSYYGVNRTTYDVDLVADFQRQHVEPFCCAVEGNYYVAREAVLDAIARESSFNLVHNETALKVDIFVGGRQEFARTQLARRIARDQDGTVLYYASPEDTILAKLRWYRMGGETSERQWNDLTQVAQACRDTLDLDYMHDMAGELGVTDLLKRAMAEAAL